MIRKVWRFWRIYGLNRTYVKVFGRLRRVPWIKLPVAWKLSRRNVAIIGAGQFSFANTGLVLKKNLGSVTVGVYDINHYNSRSYAAYYNTEVYDDYIELLEDPRVEIVYVASNHASHTFYAVEALRLNKKVYVEKPISVSFDQLNRLLKAKGNKELFVGYNRPFSPAIRELRDILDVTKRKPLTLSCFITGHKLEADHWYRNPEEGTRVCGNIGHWLDLTINFLNRVGLPNCLDVTIRYSNVNERDENLSIVLTSEMNDLISIVLSAREEPFEGINESINIQYSHVIAKIDDFRRMTIWNENRIVKRRYFRKDVGTENALMQPFSKQAGRDFSEIEISTKLMLEITESIKKDIKDFTFYI